MTRDEFKSHLEELQRILPSISEYYKIWLQLQSTERRIVILNRFNGLFVPVRQALFEMMFIHAAKIFEHNSETISLWRLVDTASRTRRWSHMQNRMILTTYQLSYHPTKPAYRMRLRRSAIIARLTCRQFHLRERPSQKRSSKD